MSLLPNLVCNSVKKKRTVIQAAIWERCNNLSNIRRLQNGLKHISNTKTGDFAGDFQNIKYVVIL